MSEATLDQVLAVRRGEQGEIINVDEASCKLVVFVLDNDWFAFPGERVKEILADCQVFPLPGSPASLEGVINVRGDIESVISLRPLLGYPPAVPSASSRVLLTQGDTVRSGVRVDRVEDVLDVIVSAILPPPFTLTELLRPLVSGIFPHAGHQVSLLDCERLFAGWVSTALPPRERP